MVHFVRPTNVTSWFCIQELLSFTLDPLPQLVPLFGIHFLLLFALQFYQAVPLLVLSFSKRISSHGAYRTALVRFWTVHPARGTLYKSLNTVQYNLVILLCLEILKYKTSYGVHGDKFNFNVFYY